MIIHGLLLYRKIVIPTNDFIILKPLVDFFGRKNFFQLLDREVIGFIRVKGSLFYGGGKIFSGYFRDHISQLDNLESIKTISDLYRLGIPAVHIIKINALTTTVDASGISWPIFHYSLNDYVNQQLVKNGKVDLPTDEQGALLLPIEQNSTVSLIGGNTSKEFYDPAIKNAHYLSSSNLECVLVDLVQCSTDSSGYHLDSFAETKLSNKIQASKAHKEIKDFFTSQNAALFTVKSKSLHNRDHLEALLQIIFSRDAEPLRVTFQQNLLENKWAFDDLYNAYVELLEAYKPFEDVTKNVETVLMYLQLGSFFLTLAGVPYVESVASLFKDFGPRLINKLKPNPRRFIRQIQSITS